MQKITFEDYKKAVKAKFEIEKEGVYFNFLSPPSQANLRNLCWERFKSNTNADDLSTFSSFFEFEFDPEKKNHFKEQTDRFRPIGSFLKGEKDPANRFAVELAAVLIDFKPRPFKKFREAVVTLPEKPIEDPKIPLPFSGNIDKEQEEENKVEEDEGEEESDNENQGKFEDGLRAGNQSSLFGNLKNRFSENFSKKLKKTIIATIIIFALTATTICYFFFKKTCMQWSDNHYELVYCDKPLEGNLNEIILRDDNLLNFKKLMVCDTTTCFKPDGEAIVWYAKRGDKADFFNANGNGRHPETKRSLRPVTEYIRGKYKGDCASK